MYLLYLFIVYLNDAVSRYSQGCTRFPKIWMQPQNSGCLKGDTKFRTVNPQPLCTTMMVTWCPGFVHPRLERCSITWQVEWNW